MSAIRTIINDYKSLPGPIYYLILVQFFLNLSHVSFVLILNIFMRDRGYSDIQIANLNSYRFLGALIFSLPLGIYIKERQLKPFFILSSIIVPLSSLSTTYLLNNNIDKYLAPYFFLWGIGMMMINVSSIPFIIRNTNSRNSTESLSLSFSTWSLAMIFSGLIIAILKKIGSISIGSNYYIISEYYILLFISTLSLVSIVFAINIYEDNPKRIRPSFLGQISSFRKEYDWGIIFIALAPLVLIAIGAGLTIPFINLFFNSIFGFNSSEFSILGSVTSGIVFLSALFVPFFRKKYGYWFSIVLVQILAVACLIILAFTQVYSTNQFAVYVAVLAYIMRQPLMHMAHPASSELIMNFVGKKNRELISGLNSSLWSASWFFSAKIFQILRKNQFEYYKIFLFTALLYVLGIILYSYIIKLYIKNKVTL